MAARDFEAINRKMVEFAPELASTYAVYPMDQARWFTPREKGPKGEDCFVASGRTGELKPDYVFGQGSRGEGYYSLMTQAAYVNLFNRMMGEIPGGGCCACSKAARQEYSDWDDVKRIVYNRSKGTIPNDGVAAQDAIQDAQTTAQSWHNQLQNEQLLVGGIQIATL